MRQRLPRPGRIRLAASASIFSVAAIFGAALFVIPQAADAQHTKSPPAQPPQQTVEHLDRLWTRANEALLDRDWRRAVVVIERMLGVLEARFGNNSPELLTALDGLASAWANLAQHGRAEPYLRQALVIRETTYGKRHSETIDRLSKLGLNLAAQEKRVEADSVFRDALARAHGDPIMSFIAGNNLAENLAKLGHYSEAISRYHGLLARGSAAFGENHPALATANDDYGHVLAEVGLYEEAEGAYRAAARIAELNFPRGHIRVVHARQALAVALENQGKLVEAEAILRNVRNVMIGQRGRSDFLVKAEASHLGRNLNRQGRFDEADAFLRDAVAGQVEALGDGHPNVLRARLNLAANTGELGRIDLQERELRDLVGDFSRMMGRDHPETLAVEHQLAVSLADQNQYAEAADIFQGLLVRREQFLDERDQQTLATRSALADALLALGETERARDVIKPAQIAARQTLPDAHPVALSIDSTANMVSTARGDVVSAARGFERTFQTAREGLGPSHPTTLKLAQDIAVLALEHTNEPEKAREYADFALERFSARGQRNRGPSASASLDHYGRNRPDLANLLLRALYSEGMRDGGLDDWKGEARRAQAFQTMQMAANPAAADAFSRAAGRLAAGRNQVAHHARRFDELLTKIAVVDSNIAASFQYPATVRELRRTTFEQQRRRLEGERESVERSLREEAPDFFALINPEAIKLTEVVGDDYSASVLGPDEALIILSAGEASGGLDPWSHPGFVFVATREHTAWVEIAMDRSALRSAIDALRDDLDLGDGRRPGRPRTGAVAQPSFDRTTAYALYDAIFGDARVQRALHGKTSWILAPQGPYLSLPFNVLTMRPPPGDDTSLEALRRTHWLGLERTLSIVPSVQSLVMQRRRFKAQAPSTTPLFALADPDFRPSMRPSDSRSRQPTALDARAHHIPSIARLVRLGGTADEARAVADVLDADIERSTLMGREASETNLLKHHAEGNLGRARILLFATHGLMGTETGFETLGQAALALAPPAGGRPTLVDEAIAGEPDRIDDGLLTATEAARLELNAELVILSACNTALGRDHSAEGLSGLAQGFIYANAQNLLVSHWTVDDGATAELIVQTVQTMHDNPKQSRAEALRAAMTHIAADTTRDLRPPSYAHPALWAPFMLVGAH